MEYPVQAGRKGGRREVEAGVKGEKGEREREEKGKERVDEDTWN